MSEPRYDDGRDSSGLNANDGLGFFFNRSSIREFIRANEEGVVTHRLFIYQNGSSPGQIENDERDTLTAGLPLLTPVWQEHGNAPERRGRGPVPMDFIPQLVRPRRGDPDFVPQLARPSRGAGGGGGGAGGGGGGAGGGGAGGGGGGAGGGRGRGAEDDPSGYNSGIPVLAGLPVLAGPPVLAGRRGARGPPVLAAPPVLAQPRRSARGAAVNLSLNPGARRTRKNKH